MSHYTNRPTVGEQTLDKSGDGAPSLANFWSADDIFDAAPKLKPYRGYKYTRSCIMS